MSHFPPNAALLLIDVQCAFDDPSWGERNNPQAEQRIARLLAGWRASGRPVIHVQHRSTNAVSLFHPAHAGYVIKEQAQPLVDEPVFCKNVNSAFIGTALEQHLRSHVIDTLVLAGLTTDHCVSTSARMAGNLGFSTYVVEDACATFARSGADGMHFSAAQMHATALASLHVEFATVISSTVALAELAVQGPVSAAD